MYRTSKRIDNRRSGDRYHAYCFLWENLDNRNERRFDDQLAGADISTAKAEEKTRLALCQPGFCVLVAALTDNLRGGS